MNKKPIPKARKKKISEGVKKAHARKKAELEQLKKQAGKTNEQKQQEEKEFVAQKKQDYLQKIEPYLKAGLSVRKACLEAGVPHSTVYEYIQTDDEFSDKVDRAKQFLSILTSNVFYNQLVQMGRKISTVDEKGNPKKPEKLTKEELNLIMWHSTKSKAVREEYGEHSEIDVTESRAERVEKSLGKNIEDVVDAIVKKQNRSTK